MYIKRFIHVLTLAFFFLVVSVLGLALSANPPQTVQASPNQPSFAPADVEVVELVPDAPARAAPARLELNGSYNVYYVASPCDGVPAPCYTSVQAAIDAAHTPTDLIKVAAGTYSGVVLRGGTLQTAYISKTLILQGGYTTSDWNTPDPVAHRTVLDAGGGGRVIFMTNTVTATVAGFDIRNGRVTSAGGGGVYVGNGNLTLQDNRIYNNVFNSASSNNGGGGILIAMGSSTLQDNEIYNNTANITTTQGGSGGGGVYVYEGNATLERNAIWGNQSRVVASSGSIEGGGGGGIFIRSASGAYTSVIRDNRISTNTVTLSGQMIQSGGGGVYVYRDDTLVELNEIYNNTANTTASDDGGGGLYVHCHLGCAPHVTQNKVYNNSLPGGSVNQRGGGVYVYASGALVERNAIYDNTAHQGGGLAIDISSTTVQNNLIYSNTAADGGGIFTYQSVGTSNPTLVNNTIYSNQANPGSGGGIHRASGSPTIRNNIIANNTGYGVYAIGFAVYYSDFSNNSAGTCILGTTCTAVEHNIFSDPLFKNPPVNLRLQSSSPCIDAADPSNYPATDYDGYARPFGQYADMGAFEFYAGDCFAQVPPDTRVYTNAQTAIDVAGSGALVKLAGTCADVGQRAGLWQLAYVSKTVTLRGGYTTTNWDTSNPTANPTTLDAMGQGRAIYITGNIAPTVEGLRITGGDASLGGGANQGGGVHVVTATATLKNCQVFSNTAQLGGGMFNLSSDSKLVNVNFYRNTAQTGAGMYNTNSAPRLVNVTFNGNTASASGGGMANAAGSSPTLANVTFSGNAASTSGGGIYNANSAPQIVNVTLSSNSAGQGGGVFNSSSNPTITNSILWSNASGQISGTGSLSVSYCLVQGGYAGGSHIISGDPLFVRDPGAGADATWGTDDDDYGDLRLRSTSPAIDQGRNAAVPPDTLDLDGDGNTAETLPLDMAGNPRINGTPPVVDLGAYEATIADLRLTKTVVPSTLVSPGDLVTYTLTFSNAGPSIAPNVVVADQVPISLTQISFTSTGALVTPVPGVTYTWQVTNLNPGDGGVIIVNGVVKSGLPNYATFTNTASITSTAVDTDTANNGGSAALTVTVPVLSIGKQAARDPVPAGKVLTYTLTVTNSGDIAATGVTITDTLPANTAFRSADSGGVLVGSQVRWTGLTVGIGSHLSVRFSVTVTKPLPNGTLLHNDEYGVTSVQGASAAGAPLAVTVTSAPDVSIRKTATPTTAIPGQPITFTLTFSNAGNDTAANVVVTDIVPVELTGVSFAPIGVAVTDTLAAPPFVWDVQDLLPDASGAIRINGTVRTGLPNHATFTNLADIATSGVETNTTDNSHSVLVMVTAPALSIDKVAIPDPVPAGEVLTYTLTVTNSGDIAATGVTITDTLPANTAFRSADSGGVLVGSQVRWTGLTVGIGSHLSVRFSVTVTKPLPNGTLLHNDEYGVTSVQGASAAGAPLAVTVTSAPDVSIRKTATPTMAAPGQAVTYTLVFTNVGNDTAANVVITDIVPISFTVQSIMSSGVNITDTHAIPPYVWSVQDLLPDAGGLIVINGMISPTLRAGNTFTNTALIAADAEINTANNSSGAPVIVPNANLAITKTAWPDPAIAGESLYYTITIVNLGPDPAYGVVLSDTLPPSTTLHTVDQTDYFFQDPFGPDGGEGWNIAWHDGRPNIPTDNWIEMANPITPTGVYTSRVMDGYNAVTWNRLAWIPRRPYGKALPDGGQAETAYDLGNANMSGNALLLHLDEAGPTSTFSDTSGLNHIGACPAAIGETCPTPGALGRLGSALSFDGALSQTIVVADDADPTRFAMELWVRSSVVTNTSFILRTDAVTSAVRPGHYSQLLGISGSKFIYYVNDGAGKTIASQSDVMTDTWYHVVGTAQSGGEIRLYVNGALEARQSGIRTLWVGGTQYRLGASYGLPGAARYFSGDLDEVAVYSRTLSTAEIADHYLRGALRMDFQVRSCDDEACAGESFVGPGGLLTTTYSELNSTRPFSLTPAVALSGISPNRYFQYQAALASDNPAYSPQLRQVDIGPAHSAVTATQGSCIAPTYNTFTCNLGIIPSGGVVTVAAGAWINPWALGIITNTAAITAETPDSDPLNNTAVATATVEGEANLIIEKYDEDWNDGTDPVSPGGPMIYTLLVRNAGPSTARSVVVTDAMPGTVITVTAPDDWNPCQFTGQLVTCTIANLGPTGYNWQQVYDWEEIVITAIAPLATGIVTNTAGAAAATPELRPGDNITYETTLVTPVADVWVEKIASPNPVEPGQTLVYTITVTNNGPYTATNVIVTDTLPAGLTGTPVGGSEWTCSPPGNRVVCRLNHSLAATQSAAFVITTSAPQSGFLVNHAHVTADQYDIEPDNNWDSAYTAVLAVADLSISKYDTPDPVDTGAPLTYTLVVTNTGPAPAGVLTTSLQASNGIAFDIPIMAGRARPYRSSIHLTNVPGYINNVTVTLRNLSHSYPADLSILLVGPNGQSVVLMSSAGGGTAVNNLTLRFNDAGVSMSEPLTSTVVYRPTNNGLSMDFPPPAPSSPYGGSLSTFIGSDPNGPWRLYVMDTVYSDDGQIADGWRLQISTATTDTVTLTDTLPAGLTNVQLAAPPAGWQCDLAGSALACQTNYFAVGTPAIFTINATAPLTGGVITNTASITSTITDMDQRNNTVAITTTVSSAADLGIAKRANASTVYLGDPITYTLSISNNGPSAILSPVVVTDRLPAGLAGVVVYSGAWTCDTSALPLLTCTIGALPLGPAPDIVVAATAPATDGIITNTASVTSTITDMDQRNNTVAITTTVSSAADLGIAKRANASTVYLGDPITYTLSISNNGPSAILSPVVVTDRLPAGLAGVVVYSGAWTCDTSALPLLTCTIGALPLGPAPDIVIAATVPATTSVLVNTASVASMARDPNTTNNTDSVTTNVTEHPIMGLMAYNSSPTVIGNPTFLTATFSTGENVSFAWDLGDGSVASGATVSHTFALVGAYTATVTASNSVGDVVATTRVTIIPMPLRHIYLPIVCKQCVYAPDLVIDSLIVTSNAVTVTIKNQGDAPVTSIFTHEFWVDVYVNPDTPPQRVDQRWDYVGPQGLAWGITADALPLNPGDVLTLTARAGATVTQTVGGAYFRSDYSFVTWTLPVNTPIWAQVDSTSNPNAVYGAVQENHEILNQSYNNITGPVYSSALTSEAKKPAAIVRTNRPKSRPLGSIFFEAVTNASASLDGYRPPRW